MPGIVRSRAKRAVSSLLIKALCILLYALVVTVSKYVQKHGTSFAMSRFASVFGVFKGKEGLGSDASLPRDKYTKTAEACIQTLDGKHGLDCVGGCTRIKEHMTTVAIAALKRPDLFFNPSLPQLSPARRYLFYGPPGTGKTLVARAVASDGGATFMNVTLSTIEDKYFGETPKILGAVFQVAKHKARSVPVVLMFDELDGMLRARRDDDQAATYGLKTEMLRLLDTIEASERIVVVGCTNHEQALDEAVRRRFGLVVRFALPDEAERGEIVRRIVQGDDRDMSDKEVRRVAAKTEGMTGASLANLYHAACGRRLERLVRDPGKLDLVTPETLADAVPPMTSRDFVESLKADSCFSIGGGSPIVTEEGWSSSSESEEEVGVPLPRGRGERYSASGTPPL